MQSVNSSTDSSTNESWVQWFCNNAGSNFYCEIDRAFIEDSFNLYGLKAYLPKNYSKALEIILDRISNY